MKTIEVQYKCECMRERAPLQVPERRRACSVVAWVEDIVMPRVAKAHHQRNPLCKATTLESLLIPTPKGTIHIGEVPDDNV